MKKKLFSWGADFTIKDADGNGAFDINDGEDDVLILACTVVIERCQEEARRRSS